MTKDDGPGFEIGIDTGGTFTDVVCFQESASIRTTKIPSTPEDPSAAILKAIDHAKRSWDVSPKSVQHFGHGTTVATNAVIERKSAFAKDTCILKIDNEQEHKCLT